MKVAILNDTYDPSLTGGHHFGCQLVMEAMEHMCAKHNMDIVQRVKGSQTGFTIRDDVDLVIVNGEGSLHHDRRQELLDVAATHKAALINAVWEANSEATTKKLQNFAYVAFRESMSRDEAGVGEVVPDLCFAAPTLLNWERGVPTEDVGYTDNVTNQLQGGNGGISAIQSAEDFLTEICKYTRMCCGRFHAIVACAVLGIPFSAWPSNTHKNLAIMEDMLLWHKHHETYEEALAKVPTQKFTAPAAIYASNAYDRIDNMFERLSEL